MVKTVFFILLLFCMAFADEIEDEIVKNLDFFMNMEVLEEQDFVKDWQLYADEKDKNGGPKNEKHN